jgi:acyl carrier protein
MSRAATSFPQPRRATAMPHDPLREYLLTNIIKNSAIELTDDTRLIQDGLLNSIGITKLVTFLSDTLGCKLEEDDYKVDNFETLGSIRRLLERRSADAAVSNLTSAR